MASSIKLLINIVKLEVGSDVPKSKQHTKDCYTNLHVKDNSFQTGLSKPGDVAVWNELAEFDLQGWWYKYNVILTFHEKRKLRKDALLGGLSLTVNELLDAVGFDTGLVPGNEGSRAQGFQQNSVLGVKQGANPSQIFWCPIRQPPNKKNTEGETSGRVAIRIDYINKQDIPSNWSQMNVEQKLKFAQDARAAEQQQIEENNRRYQQAGASGGSLFSFGGSGNKSSMPSMPSGQFIATGLGALVGVFAALYNGIRNSVPGLSQYTNNKSAVSFSIWWCVLALLCAVLGTSHHIELGFMAGLATSFIVGSLLLYWAVELGTNYQLRAYDFPAALASGLIVGYTHDLVNDNLVVRLISILLLGMSAGWSTWYTIVTTGNSSYIHALYNSESGESGTSAISRTVGNGFRTALKPTMNIHQVDQNDHFIVRCAWFVGGVIITQWIAMLLVAAEQLGDAEILTQVLAMMVPVCIYAVLYSMRQKIGALAGLLAVFNTIVFMFGVFLFMPYMSHVIAYLAKQVIQFDLVHLMMIPIAAITASLLEQSRSANKSGGSRNNNYNNNNNNSSQYGSSNNNQQYGDDYETPGRYDDPEPAQQGYRMGGNDNNDHSQYLNQVRQSQNTSDSTRY